MKVLYHLNAGQQSDQQMVFNCVGCNFQHSFRITPVDGASNYPVWDFDGNVDRPTFSPSLMVNRGMEGQCHLFVRNGKIEYLDDCHHDLRGQIVDMIEIDW